MKDLNLSRELLKDFNLTCKHLFKKKAGNAKFYYQLRYDNSLDNDLKEISKLYNNDIPFKIFGFHTNIYITENGYDGYYIDVSLHNQSIKYDKENKEFIVPGNVLTSTLVNYTMKLGYDFASLTGIPGTVAAGIVGNASWAKVKAYSEYVKKLIVYDFKEGKEIVLIPDDNFFSLRNSFIKTENRFKTRYFVKSAVLKSDYIGTEQVREKYLEQINTRRESLKIGFTDGCAGSLWANIDLANKTGKTFRKLIENHPEFEKDFNGARYSKRASRFFITEDYTTDKDVAQLFDFTVKKLNEFYNVTPHKEVLILDYDGEIDLDTFLNRYL